MVQFVENPIGHIKDAFNKYKGLLNGENLKNVKDKAIKAVLVNWYVLIGGAAIVVVSNVYTALDEKGCIDSMEMFMREHLVMIQNISKYCTKELVQSGGPMAFYECTGYYDAKPTPGCL